MAGGGSKILIKLGLQSDNFKKGLTEAKKRTSFFAKQVKAAGTAIIGAFAVQAIFQFGKAVMQTNIEFEKSMSGVKAITGATDEEFKMLVDSARELGKVTTRTASEVASLQTEFAKIGFTTKEIIAATNATIKLSEATGEELAMSAQVAGATIRGFGLEAQDSGAILDVMAKSFTSSALNLERWGESMKYVAPVAEAAGISVEETAAMMSVLADAGIHGSMAGTAMRKMMLELTKSGKPLSETLEELGEKGITLADANDLVGERAQTALLVLSKQHEKVKELTGSYDNASGSLDTMAGVATDNVTGALSRLSSAWEELTLNIGKSNGALQAFIDAEAAFLNGLDRGTATASVHQKAIEADRREVQILAKSLFDSGLAEDKATAKRKAAAMMIAQYTTAIHKLKLGEVDQKVGIMKQLNALQEYLDSVEDGKPIIIALTEEEKKSNEEIEKSAKAQSKLNKEITDRIENEVNLLKIIQDQSVARKKAAEDQKRINDEAKGASLVVFDSDEEIEDPFAYSDMTDQAEQMTEAFDLMAMSMDKLAVSAEFMGSSFGEQIMMLFEKTEMLKSIILEMAATIGESIGKMFSGDAGAKSFFEGILNVALAFMKQFGQILIATGTTMLLATAGATGWPLVAGGIALIAAASALPGILGFAEGGLVTGPTLGMIGEGIGTSRSNPEVVAPLDKLMGMMGGGGSERLVATVTGEQIQFVLDRNNKRRSQSR